MSILEATSIGSGYRQLEEELATGTPPPAIQRKVIPLEQLEVMTSVFQPRSVGDDFASEKHTKTLMEAIMQETGNVLDPVTCWWSGRRWLVLDGHHRLAAYNKLRESNKGAKAIPVTVFLGSLQSAHLESIRLNSKDKLAMSRENKSTKAWHLVMLSVNLSKREIANVCKVGTNTVSRMRARRLELIEQFGEKWLEQIDDMSWKEVLNFGVQRDYDEEWQDRTVNDWTRRLQKTFGNTPQKQPELFARALEGYSPELYKGLAEWLRDDFGDEFDGDY